MVRKGTPHLSGRMKQQMSQQDTSEVAEKPQEALSTDEGQAEVTTEPEIVAEAEPKTPAEGYGQGCETSDKEVQNLDSKVAEAADSEVSALEKALSESKEPEIVRAVPRMAEPLIVATITPEAQEAAIQDFRGKVEVMEPALGQQADGTYKLVLTVQEGYAESIKQEAEANGRTPEEWCSEQFNFFIESWWSPAKGR